MQMLRCLGHKIRFIVACHSLNVLEGTDHHEVSILYHQPRQEFSEIEVKSLAIVCGENIKHRICSSRDSLKLMIFFIKVLADRLTMFFPLYCG